MYTHELVHLRPPIHGLLPPPGDVATSLGSQGPGRWRATGPDSGKGFKGWEIHPASRGVAAHTAGQFRIVTQMYTHDIYFVHFSVAGPCNGCFVHFSPLVEASQSVPPFLTFSPLGASQAREFQNSNIHARYPSKTLFFTLFLSCFPTKCANLHVFDKKVGPKH